MITRKIFYFGLTAVLALFVVIVYFVKIKPAQAGQNSSVCLNNCESTRDRCYKDGKSTIACENDYDKCVLKCN